MAKRLLITSSAGISETSIFLSLTGGGGVVSEFYLIFPHNLNKNQFNYNRNEVGLEYRLQE